ncbi:MAG: hypothetical protein V4614_17570 [Pseudomonadota bacterium]
MAQALVDAGITGGLALTLTALASTAAGALAGGTAGAAAAFNEVTNNYLTHTQIVARDKAIKLCQANGNTACEVKTLADYDLLSAKNSGAINYGTAMSELALQGEKAELEKQVNDTTLSAESRQQVQRSIRELDLAINAIQKSPALRDAAEIGVIGLDVATLGELAGARVLTSTIIKQFAARAGSNITDDMATRVALNFYKDIGADLGPAMYRSAGENSTHNPQALEVVLGRYYANSPQSYEQIAKARGATYFEMGDWGKTQGLLGADKMWNINKAFLDQQISQGKTFIFTSNPSLLDPRSYGYREFIHLKDSGYSFITDLGGQYRAVKK